MVIDVLLWQIFCIPIQALLCCDVVNIILAGHDVEAQGNEAQNEDEQQQKCQCAEYL